jgi:hypothetical protein
MDPSPKHPRHKSACFELSNLCDGLRLADHGHGTFVMVAEGLAWFDLRAISYYLGDFPSDNLAGITAHLNSALRHAWHRL